MTTEKEAAKAADRKSAKTGKKTAGRAKTAGRTKAATGAPAPSAKGGRGGGKKAASGRSTARGATGGRTASKGETPRAGEQPARQEPRALPRLLDRFRSEITPRLIEEFSYASTMQVPRISKIVINIGIGAEAMQNAKAIEAASRDLTLISGQHPVTTRARKSIAGFKLREGMPMGLTVTLRGRRMYEFFDRLINSSLPRIRDFRGVSRRSFDGRGNFALGIKEQVIFPEIDYNSIDRIRGLEVAVVTTARTDGEGLRLLELLGVPFASSQADIMAA